MNLENCMPVALRAEKRNTVCRPKLDCQIVVFDLEHYCITC